MSESGTAPNNNSQVFPVEPKLAADGLLVPGVSSSLRECTPDTIKALAEISDRNSTSCCGNFIVAQNKFSGGPPTIAASKEAKEVDEMACRKMDTTTSLHSSSNGVSSVAVPEPTQSSRNVMSQSHDNPRGSAQCDCFATSQPEESFVSADTLKVNHASHLSVMDPSTVQTYFQYYSKMSNQMNMLQDTVRTTAYRRAILENPTDFVGKTVMDVGAGSGILSFFAVQAGAAKVYAVEASSVATVAENLVKSNSANIRGEIKIMKCAVESIRAPTGTNRSIPGTIDRGVSSVEVSHATAKDDPNDVNCLPALMDVLVSEPIGTFLFNERMIETFLYARDNFLKKGGKMFPNRCRLSIAPFTDSLLYQDMSMRSVFWQTDNFYGIDLSSVAFRASEEQFRQPIVDYIDPSVLLATALSHDFDLETVSAESLKVIQIPLTFLITSPCIVHGMAGWFDVSFDGTDSLLNFSTSPWSLPTHWYQIRFLFLQPLAVNPGQRLEGYLLMTANNCQSYNIVVNVKIAGTDICTTTAVIDLKDPDYRYYSNPAASYYPPTQQQPQQQQQPSAACPLDPYQPAMP